MVSGGWAGMCDDGWEFVDRMAIGQVKTRLGIVDGQKSSCIGLDADDDADVDVPHDVEIFTLSTRHSRTYLSATPQVSTPTK